MRMIKTKISTRAQSQPNNKKRQNNWEERRKKKNFAWHSLYAILWRIVSHLLLFIFNATNSSFLFSIVHNYFMAFILLLLLSLSLSPAAIAFIVFVRQFACFNMQNMEMCVCWLGAWWIECNTPQPRQQQLSWKKKGWECFVSTCRTNKLCNN